MFIGILRTIGTVAGLALGGAYMGKFNPSGRDIKILIGTPDYSTSNFNFLRISPIFKR